MLENNIGEARRRYSGLSGNKVTQDVAAKLFGVSTSTYKRWEQGVGNLDGNILCDLADKYSCSVDYLLCRTTDPRPYKPSAANHYRDDRQRRLNGYYESVSDATKDKMLDTIELMADGVKARIEKDGAEHADDTAQIGA